MPVITGGNIIPGNGVNRPILNAGAPGANAYAGTVIVGSQIVDTTNGKLYICTATNGSSTATWTVVGAQT
jgi:hypothetical protein